MERAQGQFTMDSFFNDWNVYFPNHQMTVLDLKKPLMVMEALFQLLNRLGIDLETVLAVSDEDRNDHTMYYWDLLPVINMKRIINHLVSIMPQVNESVRITHFLQPTVVTSHSILLMLFNLMVFNEGRLQEIAPLEEELFARTDHVRALEEKKNKLLEMLNKQAEEKGKRAERMEKLERDIKQYEEELKHEKEAQDEEEQELEAILKENRQVELAIEQKKTHRDALLAEVAKKKALRVYDADDIKAQAEQAAQNVKEAEEKLDSLRATLMLKENSLQNLQTIKPNLDQANNLLHEIMKLSDNRKDLDTDPDSKEGELAVLQSELCELRAQLSELRAERSEASSRRAAARTKRQHERTLTYSLLREAEEKDKKVSDKYKKALDRIEEVKRAIGEYESQKAGGLEQLAALRDGCCSELKSVEEILIKKALDVKKNLEDKLRKRHD